MKILLIDDEEQAQFQALAEHQGIKVLHDPTRTVDQSLEFLRKSFWDIDGVIVDGILDPTRQFQGLTRSIGRIQELNGANHWWKPFCIWTGYAKDTRNVVDHEIPVFEKGEGGLPVLEYLKDIIQDLPAYKVKMKFKNALKACDFAGLTNDSIDHIHAILRNLMGNSTLDTDYPKHLRSCLESMFRSAHRLGLVHEKCIDRGQVNLTACSIFLSGRYVNRLGIQCTIRHVPELVEQHIHHILNVTNAFSHTEDETSSQNKGRLEAYRAFIDTPYLLYSLTFQLLDVLSWYEAYAKTRANVEENKRLWKDTGDENIEGVMITGEVQSVHERGFGFFTSSTDNYGAFIPPTMITKHKLKQGMKIEVTTMPGEKGPVVSDLRILG